MDLINLWKKETDKNLDPISFRPRASVAERLAQVQQKFPGTSRNRIINDLLAEALRKIEHQT